MSRDKDYSMDDLHSDIWALYRAGLIEAKMREDGEWVFNVSAKAASMSEEEIQSAIESMDEYDISEESDG
jgi:hypothetical protein